MTESLPTDPGELVESFCAAWEQHDVDAVLAYFAEGAVYHNIPMDPCEGVDEIRTFLEGFFAMASSISFLIHRQVAAGGIVMNERTDTIVMDGRTVALPVAGVFEVAEGRIVAWRDYFDMGQFTGG